MTGQSVLPVQEDVTVTITSPSGVVFEDEFDSQTQYFEYKSEEGDEMVGDWEISLESNDPASDFTYNYNWESYFQDNS